MEKEKILSTLQDKLGKTSLSSRTIEAYITANPLGEGQEPDEAYFNAGVTMLKALDGQYNRDVAEQVEGFKKNYRPSAEETPQPKPEAQGDGGVISELRKKIEELSDKVETAKKAEEQAKLMKQVRKEMLSQNARDEYVLEKTLEKAELDPSKNVKDLATEMLAKYDAEYKACRGDGAAPRTPNGGAAGNGSKTAASNYFAKKAKREGWDK